MRSAWTSSSIEPEDALSQANPQDGGAAALKVELDEMLIQASEAVGALVSSGASGSKRLAALRSDLVVGVNNPHALSSQVAELLEHVHTDVTRLRADINHLIGAFRTGKLSNFDGRGGTEDPSHVDAATGLCNREGAEHNLRIRLRKNHAISVAIFIVERLPLINGRFGRAAGDRVLLTVSQHFAQTLPDNSFLARWSGPAFLATFENNAKLPDLETSIQRTASTRINQELHKDGRSILMPISCFAETYQVQEHDTAENLFQRLDTFIAARVMPLA